MSRASSLRISSSSGLDPERDALVAAATATARRLRLEVDRDAYASAGRDPCVPILVAGDRDARICIVGRDLGRDEVACGQPLVGASGRAVRTAVLEAFGEAPSPRDPLLERALRHVVLTNLVPYKPPGNRPFPIHVREAFRPCVERILACRFHGDQVLALGGDAFRWFFRYADAEDLERVRGRVRFGEISCRLVVRCNAHITSHTLHI